MVKALDRSTMRVSDVTGECIGGEGPQGKLTCEDFKKMEKGQYDRVLVFDQRAPQAHEK